MQYPVLSGVGGGSDKGGCMDTQHEIKRIPRPLGITLKAMEGKREEVYEIISRKFLQGTFPHNMGNLNMERFSLLYKVPLAALQKVVKDGIQEETLFGGQEVREVLEGSRSRLLDSSLYQYGNSTARLHRLQNYLEGRIYRSQSSEPALIRELNTAIASSFKGIDSASRILSLINDALSIVPENQNQEGELSPVQILEILQNQEAPQSPKSQESPNNLHLPPHLPQNLDVEGMLEVVKETPSLEPIKSSKSISLVPLADPNGDYDKAKELEEAPIPEALTINPR